MQWLWLCILIWHILSDVGKRGNCGDVVSVHVVVIQAELFRKILLLERGRRVFNAVPDVSVSLYDKNDKPTWVNWNEACEEMTPFVSLVSLCCHHISFLPSHHLFIILSTLSLGPSFLSIPPLLIHSLSIGSSCISPPFLYAFFSPPSLPPEQHHECWCTAEEQSRKGAEGGVGIDFRCFVVIEDGQEGLLCSINPAQCPWLRKWHRGLLANRLRQLQYLHRVGPHFQGLLRCSFVKLKSVWVLFLAFLNPGCDNFRWNLHYKMLFNADSCFQN